MKFAKLLKKLGGICFLLLWIPFAIAMIKGPLAVAIWGAEEVSTSAGSDIWIFVIAAIGLGVAAAVLMVLSLVAGGFANIRIMAHGIDAEAVIRAVEQTGTTVNDSPMVDFVLEVRPKTAAPFTAKARKLVSLVDLPMYQPGRSVHVRYVVGNDHVAIVDKKDKQMLRSKGLIVE